MLMKKETNVSPFEDLTDVPTVKEMLISWLENGARDKETIQAFRRANLIPKYVFKRAKLELGVAAFYCPVKELWVYALPGVRRCFDCGNE